MAILYIVHVNNDKQIDFNKFVACIVTVYFTCCVVCECIIIEPCGFLLIFFKFYLQYNMLCVYAVGARIMYRN